MNLNLTKCSPSENVWPTCAALAKRVGIGCHNEFLFFAVLSTYDAVHRYLGHHCGEIGW